MIPLKDDIPADQLPLVTIGLIAVNVIVYVLAVSHGGSLISGPATSELVRYGAIPYALSHPADHCGLLFTNEIACTAHAGVVIGRPVWETVLTSMFIHTSIVQLAGNMLFLWVFGRNVEAAMGAIKFIAFYLLSGLAMLALVTAVDPSSISPTVGAAGAIAGVLGGYIVLYPGAGVLTLVFVLLVELPALLILGLWFALQAAFGAAGLPDPTGAGGIMAYVGHAGGFVFGLLVVGLLARQRDTSPPAQGVSLAG